MLPYSVKAYAKINLSLEILGKREDGFHELKTLMTRVSLADDLVFTLSESFSFTCSDPSVPDDESNLVVKAVRLFESKTGIPVTHAIHLVKRIPHGAGLGGGSSDAASTVLALNELYQTQLSLEDMSALCATLGSDVPFFLHDGLCLCTGRGEIITPLNQKVESPILLMKPAFAVPTPFAYKNYATAQELPEFSYSPQSWEAFLCKNDLERPVFEKYLFLGQLKSWLLSQPETHVAMMSGSGSTVYAVFDGFAPQRALFDRLHSLYGSCLSIFSEKMI